MRSYRLARPRKRWPWVVAIALVAVLAAVAVVVVPILFHEPQGLSGQERPSGFPTEQVATGDDGLTRTLSATNDDGGAVDLSAVESGDRIVITGDGYAPGRGLYVAICAIPAQVNARPGPCLGGVPEQTEEELEVGSIQYAPSNWINDDFAWRIFGARGFDDREAGTFTAYLLVGPPVDENVDCVAVECGIYTRNDHTAATDRVQDIYLPVQWVSEDGDE